MPNPLKQEIAIILRPYLEGKPEYAEVVKTISELLDGGMCRCQGGEYREYINLLEEKRLENINETGIKTTKESNNTTTNL